tara:strand:+ start:4416 stop:5249 length:834 start_codon:yes stop_codon:yes gene_type:complete
MSKIRKTIKESKLCTEIVPKGRESKKSNSMKTKTLPYDLVISFLKQQEVVKYSGTNIHDIYNGINLFLVKEEEEKKDTEENVLYEKCKPNCTECNIGYFVMDAKEGIIVCNNCGIVSKQSINVEPEFIKPPTDVTQYGRKGIKGVTKQVVDMTNRSSDDYIKKQTWSEDLHHFNAFINIPEDHIPIAENKLKNKSHVTSVSYNGKVIGVLLSYYLQEHLIPETVLKESIKKQTHILDIPTSPERKHKCVTCSNMFHTQKEARFHCKVISKYDKRLKK